MGMSFVFVGDVKVGEPLSRRLTEAGYLAASEVASADVVLTFCESQAATEDVTSRRTDWCRRACRVPTSLT